MKRWIVWICTVLLLSPVWGQHLIHSAELSGCAACHTHFGKLKKALSDSPIEESELIEGMG